MRRECRERFPRHRLQRKPLVSDPGILHGTCVTHVPWSKSGSLTGGSGETVPGIPGACATRKFTDMVRGPWLGAVRQDSQGHCWATSMSPYGVNRSQWVNDYSDSYPLPELIFYANIQIQRQEVADISIFPAASRCFRKQLTTQWYDITLMGMKMSSGSSYCGRRAFDIQTRRSNPLLRESWTKMRVIIQLKLKYG